MTSYSLQELATLAGTSGRTVRYYIQLGLLDRPEGETRAATYGPRHLERLNKIRRWQEAGFTLEEIREAIDEGLDPAAGKRRSADPGSVGVWSHLTVADGIEVHIEPGRTGLSAEEVRRLFRGVMRVYETIKRDPK
jgi:DNA-binding transcriptional MerR regulator